MQILNLDANASFGLIPEVRDSIAKIVLEESLGLNPSSVHTYGQKARLLVEDARAKINDLVGSRDSEVIFTSGATEANNLAINVVRSFANPKTVKIISSEVEHPSVAEAINQHANFVNEKHCISLQSLRNSPQLNIGQYHNALVSIMYGNNETGEVFSLDQLFPRIKRENPGTFLHADCVQALGKIPFTIDSIGADAITISGHKIGALPGVGALVVRKSSLPLIMPLITGGSQEHSLRAGTENILGISSFGFAVEWLSKNLAMQSELMRKNRDLLKQHLQNAFPYLKFNGFLATSLPNTLSITIPDVKADDLVVALDLDGILVSSGSACSSGKPSPSHVLLAYGLSREEAKSTIRISLRGSESSAEITHAVDSIIKSIIRLRTQ